MPDLIAAASVDITREVCPMTYVRTKLRLETLGNGEVLEVFLACLAREYSSKVH